MTTPKPPIQKTGPTPTIAALQHAPNDCRKSKTGRKAQVAEREASGATRGGREEAAWMYADIMVAGMPVIRFPDLGCLRPLPTRRESACNNDDLNAQVVRPDGPRL
jgi:hypothetical protein